MNATAGIPQTKEAGKKHKTLVIAGAVLAVVVAGGAGAGVRWWLNKHTPAPPAVVVNTSQNKALNGDLKTAQAQIDDTLKRQNLSADDKYMLYYQKGTNYQNKQQNQEAMASFQQALKYKQTVSLYNSMASVAEALGDNAAAISYYQKAIPLVASSHSATVDDDIAALKQKIQLLGGQQ